jgi:hypothetical protein
LNTRRIDGGFVGMHIIVPQECEGAKIVGEMWNALFTS